MAEAILRKLIDDAELSSKIKVTSGGIATFARDGCLPSLDAKLVVKAANIPEPPDFLSQSLNHHPDMVEEADLILTMTREQKERILMLSESDGADIFTLREFSGRDGDVKDPVYRGDAAYEAAFENINECILKIMEKIVPDDGE